MAILQASGASGADGTVIIAARYDQPVALIEAYALVVKT
jgi:hypothetical protein